MRTLLEVKRQKLTIVSPIHGTVTSWDIQNLLLGQTVKPGAALMEIRDLNGEYELYVRMPEQDMGHVVQAQRELGAELEVEYILSVSPSSRYVGTVRDIEAAAEVHGEEGNTVRMFARIDTDLIDPTYRRPGAELTASVYCGRRALGYAWFHRVFEFVQSRVFFRLW
jgi:hypothetical protein